jgi:hypothetical protein
MLYRKKKLDTVEFGYCLPHSGKTYQHCGTGLGWGMRFKEDATFTDVLIGMGLQLMDDIQIVNVAEISIREGTKLTPSNITNSLPMCLFGFQNNVLVASYSRYGEL